MGVKAGTAKYCIHGEWQVLVHAAKEKQGGVSVARVCARDTSSAYCQISVHSAAYELVQFMASLSAADRTCRISGKTMLK